MPAQQLDETVRFDGKPASTATDTLTLDLSPGVAYAAVILRRLKTAFTRACRTVAS